MTGTAIEGSEITSEKLAEGSIRGEVSCIDGPVKNAVVEFEAGTTFTDQKGAFILEHVPAGIGKIIIKSPVPKFRDREQNVLIESGENKKDLFIFLEQEGGTIEGTILDENNRPLNKATVTGFLIPGKPPETRESDEGGHFSFLDVPPGSYYLWATAHGHSAEGNSVAVVSGQSASVNFTLKLGNLSISGHVLKKDGRAVDCQIMLRRKGIVVDTAETKASGDGSYSFDNLAPDNYEIGIISPGFLASGWSNRVEKSETVNFELEVAEPQRPIKCFGQAQHYGGLY